jgi:hypothetical protein
MVERACPSRPARRRARAGRSAARPFARRSLVSERASSKSTGLQAMSAINRFANGRVIAGGDTSGDDDRNHMLFRIEGSGSPPIYGEYIYQFLENENDFNVEIDLFGYLDYHFLGSPNPSKRQSFSAGEASTAEGLIRSFFLSDPDIYRQSFLRPRFAGGVSFRPDWVVVRKSPT